MATIKFPLKVDEDVVEIGLDLPFTRTDRHIDPRMPAPAHTFQFVEANAPLVILKVQEMAYFTRLLETMLHDEAAVHYHLSAAASAFTSFFDVLVNQASHGKAKAWAQAQRNFAKTDSSLKDFYLFRNRLIHQGTKPAQLSNGVLVGLDQDKRLRAGRIVDHAAIPGHEAIKIPGTVLTALTHVVRVVLKALKNGAVSVEIKQQRELRHLIGFAHQEDNGAWVAGRPGVEKEVGELDTWRQRLMEEASPMPLADSQILPGDASAV